MSGSFISDHLSTLPDSTLSYSLNDVLKVDSTEKSKYPLTKRGDDFIFTGKAKVTANSNDVLAASILFGAVGGIIAANASGLYEMQIDHVNGEFIPLGVVAVNE